MPWNGTHFSNTLCFNESVQRGGCKWSSAYVLRGDCYDGDTQGLKDCAAGTPNTVLPCVGFLEAVLGPQGNRGAECP